MKNEITDEELFAELERLRPVKNAKRIHLTDIQIKLLKTAREHKRPVIWTDLAKLWSKKYYSVSEAAMRRYYRDFCK